MKKEIQEFKFYPESFDITQPPPPPPNQEFDIWPFIGRVFTKDSKQRSKEYLYRAEEYSRNLRTQKKSADHIGDFTEMISSSEFAKRVIEVLEPLQHGVKALGFKACDIIDKQAQAISLQKNLIDAQEQEIKQLKEDIHQMCEVVSRILRECDKENEGDENTVYAVSEKMLFEIIERKKSS